MESFLSAESFKKILTLTVETLEKDSTLKDRPIWVGGSYGTGKTFASFVIKHILEDNLDEVEKYFSHREINSLWQRVAGVRRKGKYARKIIFTPYFSSGTSSPSTSATTSTISPAYRRLLRTPPN